MKKRLIIKVIEMMILFDYLKESNYEKIIKSYGLNYERFISLPKDFQTALLNYLETDEISEKHHNLAKVKQLKKLKNK